MKTENTTTPWDTHWHGMDDRTDITVPIEQSELDKIHEQLGYQDSRAAWVRGAIYQRLEREMEEFRLRDAPDDHDLLSTPPDS